MSSITTQQYKLEWQDHLYEIYGRFDRRNNLNEWIYFFRRPELASAEEAGKIAAVLLSYMIQYGNISQTVVQAIEDVFHYSENREKYEGVVGYGGMETYEKQLLSREEFPPFALFEAPDGEKDYDGFLYGFRELYFTYRADDPAAYREKLEALKKPEIYHPYLALLESEYYALCGAWESAVRSLKGLEDGYRKSMHMGFLFSRMGSCDIALDCFENAMELQDGNLDPALVAEYIMCKWHGGKEAEALLDAGDFEKKGYEYTIKPIRHMLLSELSETILKKSETEELSEGELILLKEFYKSGGDYEMVAKLAKHSWEKGFEDGSWTVDMAEACLETGDLDEAERILDMVKTGQRRLTSVELQRIREIRGRLLFERGRVADAYDIMVSLCKRPDSAMSQRFILARMYIATGKFQPALELLKRLRYESAGNLFYTYELARCFMKAEQPDSAHFLFHEIFAESPELGKTAFFMVQCAIDMGLEDVQEELKEAEQYLSPEEKKFLDGQILEMKEDYRKARELYKELTGAYPAESGDERLLHEDPRLFYEIYTRYFLMVENTGGRVGSMTEAIRGVLKRYPAAADLWIYLYDFLERADMLELAEAERCCRMALKAEPFHRHAMNRLISVYADREDWEKMWEISNRMVVCTDMKEGYLYRAQSGYHSGRTEMCMQDLDLFEQLGGDKNDAGEVRGLIAMLTGNYEEALAYYETRLKSRTVAEAPCYDDVAICQCKLGRFEEAAEMMDIACENSKNHRFHILLYWIQMYMGDFAGAGATLKRYRKTCKLNRVLDDTYSYLTAELAMEAGKGMKAQSVAETIASRDGERLCGVMEMLYGNFKTAAKLFKKLVKKEPEEIDNYSWAALSLQLAGAQLEAASYANQGLALFHETYGDVDSVKRADRLCQYAFLKAMLGEGEAAESAFRRALSIPTCPEYVCTECYEAHFGLGIYHMLNGNRQDAGMAFGRALEIKPANMLCRKMMDLI